MSKLDEGKEDYEYANELKKWKTEQQQALSLAPRTSSRLSDVTHTSTSHGAPVVTRATTSSRAAPSTSSNTASAAHATTLSKAARLTIPVTLATDPFVTLHATTSVTSKQTTTSSTRSPCKVGIYFGPEVVIFEPHVPDGTRPTVGLSLRPHATYCNGRIIWGDEAPSFPVGNDGHKFDVFSILTSKPVEPSRQSSTTVQINDQSVLLTPEAMAVLFFREAFRRLSAQAGINIGSCTLAHPGLIPAEATGVIKVAILLAGIPEVTLELVTTAIAKNLLLSVPDENLGRSWRPTKIVTVYHAGPFLEVALLHVSPGKLETEKLNGYSDVAAREKNELQWLISGLLHDLRDLFAVVMMIEKEVNPEVVKALNKKIHWMHCECKIPVDPVDIAATMAHISACQSNNVTHRKRPIPRVSNFLFYDAALGAYRRLRGVFGGNRHGPAHSDWSKLITPSGRNIVRTNVERIVEVLGLQIS